MMLTEEHWWI